MILIKKAQLLEAYRASVIVALRTQTTIPFKAPSSDQSIPDEFPILPTLSLNIEDFKVVKPLARGAFGKVYLVQRSKTGDLYALKAIPKSDVISRNMLGQLLSEREAMSRATSDFVVPLYFTFQGGESLFLAMQFMPGGDLFAMLQEVGSLDEATAKFYGIEIANALEILHSRGIVHCDLKPDNLLIDEEGHLRLTDFGLSHVGIVDKALIGDFPFGNHQSLLSLTQMSILGLEQTDNTTEAPGTPEYLAPEVFLQGKVGPEADMWSFGAIMFELVEGVPPFFGNDPAEVFDAVISGKYEWSVEVSPELKDLVKGLLNVDPEKRYNINQVKKHPFFTGVTWKKKEEDAPFLPSKASEMDTSYFKLARHSLNEADALHIENEMMKNEFNINTFSQWNRVNYLAMGDLNKKNVKSK